MEEMWETALLSILLHSCGRENASFQDGGPMVCRTDGIKHLYMLTPPSNEAVFKASQGVKPPPLPPRRSCRITWDPTHVSTGCSSIKPPLVYLANPAWQEVATADAANAFSTASRFTPRNLKKKKNIKKCHVSAFKKLY